MNKKYTIDEYISMINSALEKALEKCGDNVVSEAMKYSVRNGGKRIRPILVLEFCRMCGGNVEEALPFACAIEMIHTYSLIHDDLPCMDNDDMRRGQPSCHIKFKEHFALLAGDSLLTYAFSSVLSSETAKKYPEKTLHALSVLAEEAGNKGMIGGQVIDLESEGKEINSETLEKMDNLKTGALIRASAVMGVIAAGGSEEQIEAAGNFALKLGHAFQVIDDILDVVGTEESLGKPVGSDAESEKSTYVSLLGLEMSQIYAKKLTDEALSSLEFFGEEAEFMTELSKKLLSRRN
ncbi:MAG: polyprenyl synthetase family protein [Clostridia bacterium]|nr:polyprenyl synthetase family protein [Clostridia bacterium]